jgi:hypothetical protein
VNLPANAVHCLSAAERSQVVNFPAQQSVIEIPTLNPAGLALLGLAVVATALWLRRRQRANS